MKLWIENSDINFKPDILNDYTIELNITWLYDIIEYNMIIWYNWILHDYMI